MWCAMPRRVMLVDDEAVLRHLLAHMLDKMGIAHDALEDGRDVAGALTPHHDLLLLDIAMKHSDGVEARALRRSLLRGGAVPHAYIVYKCLYFAHRQHAYRAPHPLSVDLCVRVYRYARLCGRAASRFRLLR